MIFKGELECEVWSESHPVTNLQTMAADGIAIDEESVGAAEIFEENVSTWGHAYLCVIARYIEVINAHMIFWVATESEGAFNKIHRVEFPEINT